MDEQDTPSEISGSDQCLVGLSPSFWAHIPIEIKSLQRDVKPTKTSALIYRGHPVSKCKLVAWIVSTDHKSESHFYVVDDGTGLIDVLHWTEDEELVPPLLVATISESPIATKPHQYYPGDMVTIYGKIQFNEGKIEVHSTTIMNANGDDERRHWNSCKAPELTSPQFVLEKLGRTISDQIRDQTNLPSADDSVGLWRLFGVHCPCEVGGLIKEDLLYCRCIATPEALDPMLCFRWALLNLLLRMQETSEEPLQFPFSLVANEASLVSELPNTNIDGIIRGTFKALRRDGILYLCDKDADIYALITKSRVLEPFVTKTMNKFVNEKPAFLEHVPKTKLQIVRRIVLQRNDKTPD